MKIFDELQEPKMWVEFGSGYGRGPILFGKRFPNGRAIGIEFERARYEASLRENTLENVSFRHENLLESTIPVGDVYFFYFPTGKVLDRILYEIGSMDHDFRVVVIESHGDFLDRLKFETWLEKEKEILLQSTRHYPYAVIFKKIKKKNPSIFDKSFLREILYIQNNGSVWLGESFDLEFLSEKEITLKIPPRSLPLDSILKVTPFSEVPKEFWPALKFRLLGELRIQTHLDLYRGYIRKIFISPLFELEISSGEKVKWTDIKTIHWESHLCYDYSLQYFYYPDAP